jgi:hypothetical protein
MKKIILLLTFNLLQLNLFSQSCGLSLNTGYSGTTVGTVFEHLTAVCLNPGTDVKNPATSGYYLIQTPQLENPIVKAGWNLIFDDEFNTPGNITYSSPDARYILNNKWEVFHGDNFWVNGDPNLLPSEKSYISKDNIEFADGKVRFKVTNDVSTAPSGQGYGWTSGLMNTKFDFKYCYIETRAKIHNQIGYWPQVWCFGGGATEYDFFEQIDPSYYLSNFHYYNIGDYSNYVATASNCAHAEYNYLVGKPLLGEKYYTCSMEWNPSQVYYTISNKGLGGNLYAFSRNIVGATNESTNDNCPKFLKNPYESIITGSMITPYAWNHPTARPAVSYMDVDYVRVYSKADNDFEPGSIGNWVQNTNDNLDWSIGDKTSIPGLSPYRGDNYIYVLGNAANNTKKAIITQILDLTGYNQSILTFRYHMTGTNSLVVKINGVIVQSYNGNSGSGWNLENIDLTLYDGQSNIAISYEATAGTTGDISIDNEKVIESVIENFESSSPTYEEHSGIWGQKNTSNSTLPPKYNYQWFPQTGPVYGQSNVPGICGPALAAEGSYYTFLNAGAWSPSSNCRLDCSVGNNLKEGDLFQVFDLREIKEAYLTFWYNLSDETNPNNIGDLYVYANVNATAAPTEITEPCWDHYLPGGGGCTVVSTDPYATLLFHANATLNPTINKNDWKKVSVQVPPAYMGKRIMLTFYGITKHSRSIIALDDIRLVYKPSWRKSDNNANITEQVNNISGNSTELKVFPNPFSQLTKMHYSLAKEGHVKLIISNYMGTKIAECVNGNQGPGEHLYTFDGSDLDNGVYFCTIETDDFKKTEKIILVK